MKYCSTPRRYWLFLLPIIGALACVEAFAQANSELTGIVKDQSGAVVAGATIVLTDPATGIARTTVSGSTGLYDISGLNPANYNLKVTAGGFASFVQYGIPINVSSTARVDVKLIVGAESETVTVQADSLAVQTDSNVISTVVSAQQISEIATENRNFAALAALGLGVSSGLPDNNTPTSNSSSFNISMNGLRPSHNIWLIDGGESDDRGGGGTMNIMPSQDAIAEFTVMSSNYPPDYGISSGATMSLSLKSGTRIFYGTLFEFNRNTVYDANSYFNKLSTPVTPRATVNYNIFGGNLGGPVFIPHLYNTRKERTFFFWNEEWRKLLNSAGTNVQNTIDPADIPKAGQNLNYVPPGFAPGAFIVVPNISTSASYYQAKLQPLGLTPGRCWNGPTLFDPAGNVRGCQDPQVIPAPLFDSNGILYLNSPVFPRPNVAGQDKNITNTSNPVDVRDDIVRIDHKFSDKWTILGHFMNDSSTQGFALPFLGWAFASYNTITSTLSNPSHSAAIKLSWSVNPNLLVEGSINYDGNSAAITNSANSQLPAGWSVTPVSSAFKITRNSLPGVGFMVPYFVAAVLGPAPWHETGEDYDPKVDVSYTCAKHAMKYGFSYNRFLKSQEILGSEQGNYGPSSTTNDSLMDILLGLTNSYSQFQDTPVRHYVNQTPSFYVMDNWHVTPRLSLQLGLRFDGLPHAWERSNSIANFDPAAYNPTSVPAWTPAGTVDPASQAISIVDSVPYYLNGMDLAGVNGVPRGLVENTYNTWQPRVGFSDDLFGTGKVILRGGFGTFFERTQGNDIYNAATNPPFAYDLSVGNTYLSSPGTNWQTGQTTSAEGFPIFAANLMTLARRNYAPPAVAMYSLGLQHELAPSVVWVIQYVGNSAWHQWDDRQINNIPNTVRNVTIPQPGGGNASVPVTCLAGDPGNYSPFGDDSLCQPGFQSFPGGLNQFRQYQGYATIAQQEMATNATYSGFQTGLRLQNKRGLSGEIDYTWSHEIDIQSDDNSCCVSNPWNLKYDKGSGTLDRRHVVLINYVYDLPLFAKGSEFLHSLAGGWVIAGTSVAETGLVQVVTGAGGVTGSGNTYDPVGLGGGYTVRPNIGGQMTYPKRWEKWFDTARFSNVIPVWQGGPNMGFGNSAKDAVVAPARVNFSTSVYKSFAFTERTRFELRFESFNTFNHSEPNGLNTSFSPQNGAFSTILNHGNTFGQVTGTFDPRVLELGGKFSF
jgi:hypothetical protein